MLAKCTHKNGEKLKNFGSLYAYFKFQIPNDSNLREIEIDVNHTEWGYLKKCKIGGENSLFNLLIAFSNYDPDLGYSQYMNIICTWILKNM